MSDTGGGWDPNQPMSRRAFTRKLGVFLGGIAVGPAVLDALGQVQAANAATNLTPAVRHLSIFYQCDARSVRRFVHDAPPNAEFIFSHSGDQSEIIASLAAAKASRLPRNFTAKHAPAFDLWNHGQATMSDVDQHGNPVTVTLQWTGKIISVVDATGHDVTKTATIAGADKKSLALLPAMAKTWRDYLKNAGIQPDYFAFNETPSHLSHDWGRTGRLAILLKNLYQPDSSYAPLPGILYVQNAQPLPDGATGFPRGNNREAREFRAAVQQTCALVVGEHYLDGKQVLKMSTQTLVHRQYDLFHWLQQHMPALAGRYVTLDSSYRGFGPSGWEGCPRPLAGHTPHHGRRDNPKADMTNTQSREYVNAIIRMVEHRPHGARCAIAWGPISEEPKAPLSTADMNAHIGRQMREALFGGQRTLAG